MSNASMNIKTFIEIAVSMPADISIMIRGDHGIGKSQIIFQLGAALGLKVIDRRLSQMSEGDIIGLPKMDGNTTRFMPVDWLIDACENPRLLFLDELNRASPEVMQAGFQLVLDRQLNGHKLHPETRVFTAVNMSMTYSVNNIDPALLDRFFVCDLRPSKEEWLAWARSEEGNIAKVICDFIEGNGKHLELEVNEKSDPNNVTPSRRSWDRLSRVLTSMGIIDKSTDQRFHSTCLGFIGADSTIAFAKFAETHKHAMTAKEVLSFGSTKRLEEELMRMAINDVNILVAEFESLLSHKVFTEKEAVRFAFFYKSLQRERVLAMWPHILKAKSSDLLRSKCTGTLTSVMNKNVSEKYNTLKHDEDPSTDE